MALRRLAGRGVASARTAKGRDQDGHTAVSNHITNGTTTRSDRMRGGRSAYVPFSIAGRGQAVSMKKLVGYGRDDHPDNDPDRSQVAWSVAVLDDCDACGDLRVELVVEDVGRAGAGVVAHLAPATARQLRLLLAAALREIGEHADG